MGMRMMMTRGMERLSQVKMKREREKESILFYSRKGKNGEQKSEYNRAHKKDNRSEERRYRSESKYSLIVSAQRISLISFVFYSLYLTLHLSKKIFPLKREMFFLEKGA